ncbi:hypothetical protein HZC21_04580 [Candidatus Peregrinibacteria bacterium]|nr:hypothetical protein [Candidatus Peregrinibacteria bacterium]
MDLLKKLKITLGRAKLTEAEISFYETVLKKAGSTVFEISRRLGISKDRGYSLFESLQEKKLIMTKQYCGRRGVFPISLKNFSEKLYSKSREFWRIGETLESINSALPLMRETGVPTSVEAFTINEFPEHWLDLSCTSFDHVFSYGNFGMITEQTGVDCDKQFINKRVKRGAKADVALFPNAYTDEMIKKDSTELRKTRVLDIPELENKLVVIFPEFETVSLWQRNREGSVSGLGIKNKLITDFHKEMYDYFKNKAVSS